MKNSNHEFDGKSERDKNSVTDRKELIKKDKAVREHQTEKQLDKTIEDSFPASDPPSRN